LWCGWSKGARAYYIFLEGKIDKTWGVGWKIGDEKGDLKISS
jgi:hypothetical protein